MAGVSGQAWATYVPAERAPSDGSKPRGASVFARDFQTVVIYDSQGKFVGVRRPGSGLPIQVCCYRQEHAALVKHLFARVPAALAPCIRVWYDHISGLYAAT